jgi:MoaA/NifB/PqqE/SkfB family radical SAM enzyme
MATLDELKSQIDVYKTKGYTGIILNGGEPTLHPNLPEIIRYSREQGFYVKLITNGIRFANLAYTEECARAGLQQVHISIHSYIPQVEDFLMQGEVYKSQYQWLIHALSQPGLRVWTNTAINRYNVRHLDKTVLFLLKLGVEGFVLNQLEVTGVYPEHLQWLLYRLSVLRDPLNRALASIVKYQRQARVSRVPLCYMRGFEEFSRDMEYFVLHEKKYINYLTSAEDAHYSDYESTYKNWQNPEAEVPGYTRACKTDTCTGCDLNDLCSGYDLLGYFPGEDPLISQRVTSVEKQSILSRVH